MNKTIRNYCQEKETKQKYSRYNKIIPTFNNNIYIKFIYTYTYTYVYVFFIFFKF